LLRVRNGVDLAMIRGLEITDAISASLQPMADMSES
jgi:hypothetical protein